MQANDIMTVNVATVTPDTDIKEIAKLLGDRHISGVPVVDADGHVVGIVSEGDLVRRADRSAFKGPRSWWLAFVASPEKQAREYIKDHGTHASEIMTREVISVPEDTPLHDIVVLLEKHRIKRVPVTRNGKLSGIVSRANLLQGFAAMSESAEAGGSADDRTIREQVVTALKDVDASILNFTNIVVKDGVVRLWGGVRSKAQAEAFDVAARNVPGVRKVENQIAVMPEIIRSTLWAE